MSNALNLNNITGQIEHYVNLIKAKKAQSENFSSSDYHQPTVIAVNDVRSNINPLNGKNKFSIHTMLENNTMFTSASYVAEAYNHLSPKEDRNKVLIDFMHKNNRNFDVSV